MREFLYKTFNNNNNNNNNKYNNSNIALYPVQIYKLDRVILRRTSTRLLGSRNVLVFARM